MIGETISHYRIVEKLGHGGMGVVFKAEDTSLHRFVAVKFLPDEVAKDLQALGRFQREAQVLASLNHPHIAAIYGVEDSGETHALVLELVEGETLADGIAHGPIPIEEALREPKRVDPKHDLVLTARETGISFGD